ncbi:uncharacterized protein LOC129308687 [Prosopis cineraria]|uniref:uncharacterized protein LOC129308687 n=1 Tax=Prosopis cineraria TaxID=364024 RepID=UPI0024106D2F|nr:uncharacterized protein LOC129308687 [Prosopis cineraria]
MTSFISCILLAFVDNQSSIGAACYIECSSKNQENVKSVFEAAIKVVIEPPQKQHEKKRKPRRGCLLFVHSSHDISTAFLLELVCSSFSCITNLQCQIVRCGRRLIHLT